LVGKEKMLLGTVRNRPEGLIGTRRKSLQFRITARQFVGACVELGPRSLSGSDEDKKHRKYPEYPYTFRPDVMAGFHPAPPSKLALAGALSAIGFGFFFSSPIFNGISDLFRHPKDDPHNGANKRTASSSYFPKNSAYQSNRKRGFGGVKRV
jgi:hypothetical protein